MTEPALSVIIHTDGGSRGNPGLAGAGVVIRDSQDGQTLFEGGYFLGKATNNVAEYRGVLEALSLAADLGAARVLVRSDSELLVRQMNGQYKVRNAGLKPLHEQASLLAARFDRCRFEHVRREQNHDADRLANLAMDRKANVESAAGI
jgi:ribonuclease HI